MRLVGRDSDLDLRATDHPEFDAWRWNEYWVPLDLVIEFKRGVYQMALSELARFVPQQHHNRYLRGHGRLGTLDDPSAHAPQSIGPVTTGFGDLDMAHEGPESGPGDLPAADLGPQHGEPGAAAAEHLTPPKSGH